MLNINLQKLPDPIRYPDKIMLVGSCFTGHIGTALQELKFEVLQNPNGILFDPISVSRSLVSYIKPKIYQEGDLFQLNEIWQSWDHHSQFSKLEAGACLDMINNSQETAHRFLKQADWLIITLGSSFSYLLIEQSSGRAGEGVANCHRAPASWFQKHLQEIPDILLRLEDCFRGLKEFNPRIRIIFTVSPVRHTRDGVVENNRSKARLIECVHQMVKKYDSVFYFPAYELVIDVLRDYRFYDIDLVHPNYAATSFVMEKFTGSCIEEGSQQLMHDIRKIMIARKHKAFQPGTKAHQDFLFTHLEKTKTIKKNYPFLDLDEEIKYFSGEFPSDKRK